MLGGPQNDGATLAAIAAIGAAARIVDLASEGDDPISAGTGLDFDKAAIYEHWPVPGGLMVRSAPEPGGSAGLNGFRLLDGDATVLVEFHDPVAQGEESEITTEADTSAGLELSSDLADDDISGDDALAAELLDSAKLRIGIATVPRRALPLLMSHNSNFPARSLETGGAQAPALIFSIRIRVYF
jgi:hypothetical protein